MTCSNVSVCQWKLLSKKLSRVYFLLERQVLSLLHFSARQEVEPSPGVSAANADVYQQVK